MENRLAAVQEGGRLLMAAAYDGDGNRVFQLNYNPNCDTDWKCGTTHGEHRTDTCHDGHGESQGDEWKKDTRNRYGILFPVDDRSDRDHCGLIYDIHNTGKHGDYELIEYINDVNREYTEVLVENSFGGRTDTSYIYGVDRLSFDYENGCSGYYLYDPRGSVTGITNEQGRLVRSYRYDAFGNITFGEPKYDNEYTYNGESYNPNIESQYLRARYYDVVNANFLTEDSYLGNINEPLTLNRYNYCVSSPLNYTDPSGRNSYTLASVIKEYAENNDIYGLEIGLWYLYGNGKDYTVGTDDKSGFWWKKYMENNTILTGKVGDVVIPIGENLDKGDALDIDMSFSMIIQNGEGATGYEFMHGTNETVGGFNIKGKISKNNKGDIEYDLTYTWNDIMDPNFMYSSDTQKAAIAQTIPFANPKEYDFSVSWHDKTVMYGTEKWYQKNKGWLKDWNENWIDGLNETDEQAYMWIEYEQQNLNQLGWKEYLEKIKEEYAVYYEC